ncbi:VWA domain-containing protein [Psychrosphaera aestuarii]|uniref:VWA domain-containing protein n=1 Tax=Psychrosphaera aestuarii TaxID=1266052 RepID=UPI001B31E199|nr:VWA domain-containing protein [Psychrosphaera aestuarii]
MNDFHFIRPEWFLLFIPLAVIWFFKLRDKQQSDWQQWIPKHLANTLFANTKQLSSNRLVIGLGIVWLILTIALAGPTWQKIEKPVFKSQVANVIVLDMSMSMRSTDVKPDRLTKAKFKAIDLAKSLGDSEVGLVAYAGDAFTISPLTQDARNIAALIPSLAPEIMPIPGSYPLLGLEQAQSLMQQAGYLSGQIFWITDGVVYDDVAELNKLAATTAYQINVLSVGTRSGAPIKMLDGGLLKDDTGSIVMPKVNESALADIANTSGGTYQRFTANDKDITTLVDRSQQQKLSNSANELESTNSEITGDDWQEFGPYLILIVMPLILVLFRRGVTLSVFLCGILFIGGLTPNVASAAANTNVNAPKSADEASGDTILNTMFKTDDQRASQAFKQQQYAKAKDLFENEQWKGAAAYKAADYEQALEYFSKDKSAEGYYNQGNALAQMMEIDKAIEAYDKAIQLNPNLQDAKSNKDILEKLKEQQQQQNGDQQQNDSQNSENSNSEADKRQQSESEQSESEQSEQSNSAQSQQEKSQQQNESEKNQSQQSDQQNTPSEQQSNNESDSQQNQQQNTQQQAQQQSELDEQTGEQGEQNQQPLTPEQIAEKEQQQKIKQLLRKVDDDPSVLLRNKMILESRRRQQERRRVKGATKSW